jgi:hypothetical protein
LICKTRFLSCASKRRGQTVNLIAQSFTLSLTGYCFWLSISFFTMADNSQWIEFDVYEADGVDVKAKALVVDGEVEKVKLISKVPRGYYYHFLNDAGATADELFNTKNTTQHGKD